MPFSLVIQAGCDRAERRLVGSGPTKRRACLRHRELDGHVMYESAAGVKRKIVLEKDFFPGL
jgi:hypothetical protein